MSGILDSKSRVFDTIVTLEGRRRLAFGGLGVKYVSFTDATTFYEPDLVSGSADATKRIYLEVCNLPQDQLTFQASQAGGVSHSAFIEQAGVVAQNGKLTKFGYDPTLTGSGGIAFTSSVVSGSNVESYVDNILSLSIDNFRNNMITSTTDPIFDDEEFDVGNNTIEFAITDSSPLEKFEHESSTTSMEDVFFDPRFSSLPNFTYLPPINKRSASDEQNASVRKLGDYKSLGYVNRLTHDDVLHEHKQYARVGCVKKVRFDPTSRANNVLIQGFEVSSDSFNVLDVIDFGVGNVEKGDGTIATKHVLFFGKILHKKETDSHSFVHLFTMIFG